MCIIMQMSKPVNILGTTVIALTTGAIIQAVVLRPNLITIDTVDFLRPSATLYWYVGITILAVLLFHVLIRRSMQFGFREPCLTATLAILKRTQKMKSAI